MTLNKSELHIELGFRGRIIRLENELILSQFEDAGGARVFDSGFVFGTLHHLPRRHRFGISIAQGVHINKKNQKRVRERVVFGK